MKQKFKKIAIIIGVIGMLSTVIIVDSIPKIDALTVFQDKITED